MTEKNNIKTVCHFLAFVHFFYGCYYDWNYVKIPVEVNRMGQSFGNTGKLKFLTYWDALLQTVFFGICFLNDVIGTNENVPEKTPFIRKLKDYLFSSLAFPLSMFVGITFWALYFVDRELVFPRALDPYFPTWLNHVMHTNIMIFIIIEMLTSFRRYPRRNVGFAIIGTWMVVYLIWIHVIHSYSGMWVYPVLDVLNLPLRWVFFAGLLGLSLGFYVLGERVNKVYWREQLQALEQKEE